MEIIRKTNNLRSADIFALTKGPDVAKLSDAKGEILTIAKYIVYTDTDLKGNPMSVIAIETDKGDRYASNSKTFIRNFSDILDIFEAGGDPAPTKFLVGYATSKTGREYLTCSVAEN